MSNNIIMLMNGVSYGPCDCDRPNVNHNGFYGCIVPRLRFGPIMWSRNDNQVDMEKIIFYSIT